VATPHFAACGRLTTDNRLRFFKAEERPGIRSPTAIRSTRAPHASITLNFDGRFRLTRAPDRAQMPRAGHTIAASLEQPFLMLHMEKTGGTSLRELFHEHVFKGTRAIIPCKGGVSCSGHSLSSPAHLNRTACATAFIGHFAPLALLSKLIRIDRGEYGPVCCQRWLWLRSNTSAFMSADGSFVRRRASKLSAKEVLEQAWQLLPKVLSATIMREPVERMISSYYYFAYNRAANLTLPELMQMGEQGRTAALALGQGHRQLELLASSDEAKLGLSDFLGVDMDRVEWQQWAERTVPTARRVLKNIKVVGTRRSLAALVGESSPKGRGASPEGRGAAAKGTPAVSTRDSHFG